jgi:hypothetical protein
MSFAKPTLARVWFLLPALMVFIYVGTQTQWPLDFWNHVCMGRRIWQLGEIPTNDVFAHPLAGQTIVYQGWLADLAMYRLMQWGGIELVQFVVAVGYGATVLLLTAAAWRRAGEARIAAALAVGASVLAASNFGLRSQAISCVLFAAELYVLWRWPRRGWTIVSVALIEVLWTNTHGAFPLGVVLPGVFLAASVWSAVREGKLGTVTRDSAVRGYLACVAAAAVAAFCNPRPGHTLDYVWGTASKAAQRGIGEWLPPDFSSYTGAAFYPSVAIVVLILLLDRKHWEPLELLLLVAFGLPAFRVQRMVMWWGLVLAPVLAPHVARLIGVANEEAKPKEEGSWLNGAVLLLLVAVAALSTPWSRRYNPLLPAAKRQERLADSPAAAVEFLQRAGQSGRAFNWLEWGSYLTWKLEPRVQVFIDTRVDFFPDAVWEDYVRIGNAQQGWEDRLAQYRVDLVVWSRRGSPKFVAALRRSPRWKLAFEDSLSVVFVRAAN